MIKDNRGEYYIRCKIIGNERQITVTIPRGDWRYFPVGGRVKLISNCGIESIRKVTAIGNGKQRSITIPLQDHDVFSKGNIIQVYPLTEQCKK